MEIPKVYRITNLNKIRKITVVATSLDELLKKGSQKFGLVFERCVLAETGDEIDDSEVLAQLPLTTQLMLLRKDEIWIDESLLKPVISTLLNPAANSVINNPTVKDVNYISGAANPIFEPEKPTLEAFKPTLEPVNPSLELVNPSLSLVNPISELVNLSSSRPINSTLEPVNPSMKQENNTLAPVMDLDDCNIVESWNADGNLEIFISDKSDCSEDSKVIAAVHSESEESIYVAASCKENKGSKELLFKTEINEAHSFIKAKDMITELPLPLFDQKLLFQLKSSGRVSGAVHSGAVQQTVEYYLKHLPRLKGYGDLYGRIAKKVVDEYPTLKCGGEYYWESFKKALSARIRFLRYSEKSKENPKRKGLEKETNRDKFKKILSESTRPSSSEQVTRATTPPIAKSFNLEMINKDSYTLKSQDEYHQINDIIKKQYMKYDLSTSISNRESAMGCIETGLREVFKNNIIWFKEIGNLSSIIERYPCLKEGHLWILLFELLLDDANLHVMKHHFSKFEKAMQSILKLEKTPDVLEIHNYVFENTKVTKGMGVKSKPVIQIYDDIPYEQIEKFLHSSETDGLKIVGFRRGQDNKEIFQSIYCVGHNGFIVVPNKDLKLSLFCLFALYYMLNLNYPKCYCGVLGFLQTYALGLTPYNLFKSLGFLKLSKVLEEALDL